PRYACRACEGAVVQAPAPARLIEGGLPTECLVAQVLVAKYADHCPLYRQAQGFARTGIELDRSTLAFWTGYAAAELKPALDPRRAPEIEQAVRRRDPCAGPRSRPRPHQDRLL